MMDIDRISYIFGSFARRRQSSEVSSSSKRRSVESTKIIHDRSKSTPHQPKKKVSITQRPKSLFETPCDDNAFKCPVCRKQFVEPRVLPCLHTFCVKCLEDLEGNEFATWYDEDSDARRQDGTGSRKASSGGSGYVSESPCKVLCCPSCGSRADIPTGGVASFPPNYTIQHRMVLATLNSRFTHLLCDLCTSNVTAISRCMDCAISFCNRCEDDHFTQKSTATHEVLPLEEARERGITKIRRQILCMTHPDFELSLFCTTCCQVICRECCSDAHSSHKCEPVSRAAKTHLRDLRSAAGKARTLVEKSAVETSHLNSTSKKIEAQCNKVQNDVEKFVEDYIRSIEEHKINLLEQIRQVREEKLQHISEEKSRVQKTLRDARDVAYFLDDLLNDGTDVEVLSFLKPVLNKIEKYDEAEPICQLKCSDSLQFLPEETVKYPDSFYTLYGVLTTQTISPENCWLNTDGLQNLRVGKKVEILMETRDNNNQPLDRGGETVTAEIRHRDAGVSRFIAVNVHDKRDGTYRITFVPDVAGKLALIVKVKGEPIQDSPFAITVRSLKPHKGTFHCCSFCSSGGSKEATCGCEGKMPGGYKGCGHGHSGHPGKRHWSCCGNTLEHSECGRTRSNSHYQFTL